MKSWEKNSKRFIQGNQQMRSKSSPGTPLSVSWIEEPLADQAQERDVESNIRRFITLFCAFIAGSSLVCLGSWLFGERLWFLHSFLGGSLSSMWVQGWMEKRHKWPSATPSKTEEMSSAAEIKKRRLKYSLLGVFITAAPFVMIELLTGDRRWVFDAVVAGLAGREIAIGFFERFRGLATLDDLALTRMREEMSPTDLTLNDAVPLTLSPRKEVEPKP